MDEDLKPPSQERLAWPTLIAIRESGGNATNSEISRLVAEHLDLSVEKRTVLKGPQGSRSLYEYRLAWARTMLRQMGAIANEGLRQWSITDFGRTLTEEDIGSVSRAKLDRLQEINREKQSQRRQE
jgi:restriction system protein